MKIGDLKILVCDDSILARKKIREMALKLGVKEVVEAPDGIKSVEQYKSEKPNIVFMDITMPDKDGIEALKEIMQFDSKAKVVMASSIGTSGKLSEAIKVGAFDFLQKPITAEKLEKVINDYIAKQ